MSQKTKGQLLISFLLLGFCWWGYLVKGPSGDKKKKPHSSSPPVTTSGSPKSRAIDGPKFLRSLHQKIGEAGEDPEVTRSLLDELERELLSMPPEEAAATITSFLESGTDAKTGLDFTVSEKGDGSLENAPSLRVALLDLLGRIAPKLAGPPSEEILSQSGSPDEWAVAMRNVARAYPGEKGDTLLKEKATQLLRNKEWRENPTTGFFQAFDAIVHTGFTGAIPDLATLFDDPERRDLGHAGFLTMDRLAVTRTEEALKQLVKQKDLQKSFGPMVANFFARADVRDPGQAAVLAEYLTSPNRTASELDAWAGVYPNGNLIHSNNLLTRTRVKGRDDLVDHDRKALEMISRWLTEPRFQPIRPTLEAAQNRLRNFVHQASQPERKP